MRLTADSQKAECGGIEPPRPSYGRKPVLKTGRATRPTHSKCMLILIHRLTVAAGEDAGVAQENYTFSAFYGSSATFVLTAIPPTRTKMFKPMTVYL